MAFTRLHFRQHNRSGSTRRSGGFTLIELLIAVAIIGILASLAMPSYQGYVERSLRADAHVGLNMAAGELERCYTRTYSYADCDITKTSPEGSYILDVQENDGQSYIISAATEGGDGCTYDDKDGIWLGSDGTRGPEACWP